MPHCLNCVLLAVTIYIQQQHRYRQHYVSSSLCDTTFTRVCVRNEMTSKHYNLSKHRKSLHSPKSRLTDFDSKSYFVIAFWIEYGKRKSA